MKTLIIKTSTSEDGTQHQLKEILMDDKTLRAFAHMLGACLDVDTVQIEDELNTFELLPDDNDFYEINPWLDEDAYDRWIRVKF